MNSHRSPNCTFVGHTRKRTFIHFLHHFDGAIGRRISMSMPSSFPAVFRMNFLTFHSVFCHGSDTAPLKLIAFPTPSISQHCTRLAARSKLSTTSSSWAQSDQDVPVISGPLAAGQFHCNRRILSCPCAAQWTRSMMPARTAAGPCRSSPRADPHHRRLPATGPAELCNSHSPRQSLLRWNS